MEQDEDARWRRLAALFFRVPAKPSARETDLFVERVMARLEPAAAPSWRQRLEAGWLVPALGLATALFFISILRSPAESIAAPDDWLMLESRSLAVGEMVLPPDPAHADDILELFTEER